MIEKIQGTLQKWLVNNPISNSFFARKRQEYMTEDFLSSDKYEELFLTQFDKSADAFETYLNDAEDKSANFMFRHTKIAKALGSWRWKGVYQHRKALIPVLFNRNNRGIDFGGAYGPIAQHSTIVDFNKKDIFGRDVKYPSLAAVDFKADYIFSSHTLEHIPDLDTIFQDFKKVLKSDGRIFLNLPAHSCTRWRSGDHTNRKFNDHAWTFCLSEDETSVSAKGYKNVLAMDTKVAQHFNIESAVYTGDNSIFIVAKN